MVDAHMGSQGLVKQSELDAVKKSLEGIQVDSRIRNLSDNVGSHEGFEDVGKYITQNDGNLPPDGMNANWDAVMAKVKQFPGLANMPIGEVIGLCAPTAKPEKPGVTPVPSDRKANAKTTSEKRTGAAPAVGPGGWPSNFDSLNADEQERLVKERFPDSFD